MPASSCAFSRIAFSLLLTGVILAAAAPARADTTFSSDGLFSTSDLSIWASGPAFVLNTGNRFLGTSWNIGNSAGGVECFLGACVGAKIGAETSGKFGVNYSLNVNSGSFDLLYPGRAFITVPDSTTGGGLGDPGPVTLGTSFQGLASIQTNVSPLPTNATLQVTGPTLQASLGLDAMFHAFAGAQVCVGVCYGPALGPIDFNGSKTIASINKDNSGTLTVLDRTVTARQNVSELGGLINASVNLPRLDGSSANTPGGFSSGVLTSAKRDDILTLNANLAQIAANAFGLPIPLAGNLGPFGYNLLQSNAGLDLDVEQTLSFTPSARGSLRFSSPVTPIINNVTQALTDRIDFNVGDAVTFLPGHVSGLSIRPSFDLLGTLRNRTDLVVNGNINVQALGVNIAGQSIGPLINQGLPGAELGRLSLLDNSFVDFIGTVPGNPINLDFNCQALAPPVEFPKTVICASSDYVNKGPLFTGPHGELFDEIALVSCPSFAIGDTPTCTETFSGVIGPYVQGPNGPVFLTLEFDPLEFLFNNPGASTTDADALALLAALGYQPGLPPFSIPEGAPLADFVTPEPGSIAILGVALAALLAVRRRRLGQAIPAHREHIADQPRGSTNGRFRAK